MTLLIPMGIGGVDHIVPDYLGDPDSAGDRVLQLPADDCGVSAAAAEVTPWRRRTWEMLRGCWRLRR